MSILGYQLSITGDQPMNALPPPVGVSLAVNHWGSANECLTSSCRRFSSCCLAALPRVCSCRRLSLAFSRSRCNIRASGVGRLSSFIISSCPVNVDNLSACFHKHIAYSILKYYISVLRIEWFLFYKNLRPLDQKMLFVSSFVDTGPVVLEKKLKMWKVYRWTDIQMDRQTGIEQVLVHTSSFSFIHLHQFW